MKLFGQNGVSFSLVIDGYQFPEMADDDRDSDWLFVRGEVRYAGGGWTFRDPCLTTFELGELADWLVSISRGKPGAATCSFTEPNLSFEYRSVPQPAVVARFAHESAPPWQSGSERQTGFALSFDLVLNGLATAAGDLRECLAMFPERGRDDGYEPSTPLRH